MTNHKIISIFPSICRKVTDFEKMSAKKRSGFSLIDPSILEPEIILKETKETLIIVEKPFDKKHGSHCFVLKVKSTSLSKYRMSNEKK